MKKRLFAGSLAVLAAVSALAATSAGAGSRGRSARRRGQHVRVAARVAVAEGLPAEDRRQHRLLSRSAQAAGIAAISGRTVDFGASDAPLTPDQFTGCKGCFQIPWALGGVAIMVHVKTNARAPLKMSGPVLAQIFLGAIKTWDAPAIKALNPGITFPSEPIVPVYRSDGSGTSYAFTDYLSSVSPRGSRRSASRPSLRSPSASAPRARPASPVSSRRPTERSAMRTSRSP